jgi:hypothetical protein
VFEGAKKEYDQAIDRNATLGELANQKSASSGWRPSRALSSVLILSAVAIAIAILIIL